MHNVLLQMRILNKSLRLTLLLTVFLSFLIRFPPHLLDILLEASCLFFLLHLLLLIILLLSLLLSSILIKLQKNPSSFCSSPFLSFSYFSFSDCAVLSLEFITSMISSVVLR